MKSKKNEHLTGRNWTFVIYPDSVAPNYRDIINKWHCAWAESPLHDKDINEGGQKKEPHIHIVLCFEGNKTYPQIKEICDSVNGKIAPEYDSSETAKVHSIRGMIRYLIHLDDPNKAQYEKSAIISHGGLDIDQYFTYAAEMTKRYLAEMMAWCDCYSVYEYSDLLEYAAKEMYDTWFDLLTIGRQSFVMIKYLDSRRNSAKYKED